MLRVDSFRRVVVVLAVVAVLAGACGDAESQASAESGSGAGPGLTPREDGEPVSGPSSREGGGRVSPEPGLTPREGGEPQPEPAPPEPQPEPPPEVGAGDDDPIVVLGIGGEAQDSPGCTSVHCRHLTVGLPDWPPGDYTIECWSSRDPEAPWHTATWHWPTSLYWTRDGCSYGYPGEQVRVIVNGTQSNTITWPTTPVPRPLEPPPLSEPPPSPQATGTFSAVSAGEELSCGLRIDGTVTCWGSYAVDLRAVGGEQPVATPTTGTSR